MKAIKKLTTLGFALVTSLTYAQDFKPCVIDEMTNKLFKEHPEFEKAAKLAELQDAALRIGFETGNHTATQPYVIPIVFHILHQYGTENISDAQIIDAVRGMNEDFQLRAADTNQIVPEFKNLKGNAQFEIRLATLDPNGNCTTGIDRIYTNETNIGDDGSKLNPWPRAKYLNVWVAKTMVSGAAGYSMYPSSVASSGAASIDGVMILSGYVGSIGSGNVGTARALTHEIGHWANLQHVWGNNNQPGTQCGDDQVSDTPLTKGFSSCNLTASNVCNVNIKENVQNIMDYAYCQKMFTIGQCTRMQAAMNSSTASRSNIWTNANLIATGTDDAVFFGTPVTCAPKADFSINPITICEGASVTFKDFSYAQTQLARSWTFTGGNPATSTDSIEVVTYASPGVYPVSLTVTGPTGSNTKTQTALVTVLPNVATYNGANYSEGFEGSAIPNVDWSITSNDTYKWSQVNTAKHSGTYAAKINNYNATSGDLDLLISNTLDISSVVSPSISFWYAYAMIDSTTDNDAFKVSVSTDCGRTWSIRYSKSGKPLRTVTQQVTSAFVPTAAQWKKENVSLANVTGASNVRIKFDFKGGGGNNVYLDDINIGEINAGIENNLESAIDFNIMPNPFSETSTLRFNLSSTEVVNITVYDILGKEVKAVLANERLASGNYQYDLNKRDIGASGIYFVKVNVGKATMMRKIVLN